MSFKSQSLRIKEELAAMYDTADVSAGYNYWFWKLLDVLLGMFKYDNLPDHLRSRDIELNILLTNHAIIFKKGGYYYTTPTNIYGYDYDYAPTSAVYAQPKIGSGRLEIGVDCEIIYNSDLEDNVFYIPCDSSMQTFISRYARTLADIESTMSFYLVDQRVPYIPVGASDSIVNSIKAFFRLITFGKRGVITDDAVMQKFRNVDIVHPTHDGINDYLAARDKVLEQFYRDIGIKWSNQKRAQQTEDEIESDQQLLLVNPKKMLEKRQEGIENVNKLFGLNISVKLSEEFIHKEKEVTSNDRTEQSEQSL